MSQPFGPRYGLVLALGFVLIVWAVIFFGWAIVGDFPLDAITWPW